MTHAELFESLVPLARRRSRIYERSFRVQAGEFLTAALMGAWDAVKSYDPCHSAGAKLTTFALKRIDGEIIDQYRTVTRSRSPYFRAEIAYDLTDRQVQNALAYVPGGVTHEFGYMSVEFTEYIKALFVRLDPMHAELLRRSVLNGEFLKDIAEDWGVTESRVCQIRAAAYQHARRIAEEMGLPDGF